MTYSPALSQGSSFRSLSTANYERKRSHEPITIVVVGIAIEAKQQFAK
jgi:hypothetical protein